MKTYLQSHSSTMHVDRNDNDSWSIRNTNATVSQPINLNAYKSETNSPLEGRIVLYIQKPFYESKTCFINLEVYPANVSKGIIQILKHNRSTKTQGSRVKNQLLPHLSVYGHNNS